MESFASDRNATVSAAIFDRKPSSTAWGENFAVYRPSRTAGRPLSVACGLCNTPRTRACTKPAP